MAERLYMKILVVAPEKIPEVRDIPVGLHELQNIVDGYIEVRYPFDDPVALICNEDGKNIGLPANRFINEPRLRDIICGTFFIIGARPGDEDFSSLTDELIQRYTAKFKPPEYFMRVGSGIAIIRG